MHIRGMIEIFVLESSSSSKVAEDESDGKVDYGCCQHPQNSNIMKLVRNQNVLIRVNF